MPGLWLCAGALLTQGTVSITPTAVCSRCGESEVRGGIVPGLQPCVLGAGLTQAFALLAMVIACLMPLPFIMRLPTKRVKVDPEAMGH